MITFAVFVWFTMKFVWPMLEAALEARKKQISEGLAAAEQGHNILKTAQDKAKQVLKEARQKSSEITAEANRQGILLIEEAKLSAYKEKEEILNAGHRQISQELNRVRAELRGQMADLIIKGAEKILARNINAADEKDILDKIASEM
jgi:F-type H+-transporting ATPase subunit b